MQNITKILYALGGTVVLLGVIFLMAQVWEDIGSAGRIFVTLVLGLIFAGTGSYFLRRQAESRLGSVFHLIGGLLIPGGALVTLSELGTSPAPWWPTTLTIGAVFVFYLLLNIYHKHALLTFFSLANGTAFIYLLTDSLMHGQVVYNSGDIYAYLTMVVGICYLLLAYAFRNGWNQRLNGLINFLGATGLLAATFSRVFDSPLWQVLFFAIAIGGLAYATYIHRRSVLVISTLFLIGHFVYITGEYFADSIGWPVSLVILGFIIIGLGYVSIALNKKYIIN